MAPRFDNGAYGFAAVASTSSITLWAARDRSMLQPDTFWGADRQYPIAFGTPPDLQEPRPIADDALKPSPDAVVTKLGSELQGTIGAFGPAMASLIRADMTTLGLPAEEPVLAAHYEDCYARSPIVLRLLLDTIARLNSGNAPELTIQTRAAGFDRGGYRDQVWHDLVDDRALAVLAREYGRSCNVTTSLTIGAPPHKRSLVLEMAARRIRVDLDQGFGWLQYRGRDSQFDQDDSHENQVRALLDKSGRVEMRRHASQMVVHEQ